MCINVLLACMYVHCVYSWCPSKVVSQLLELELTDGCDPPGLSSGNRTLVLCRSIKFLNCWTISLGWPWTWVPAPLPSRAGITGFSHGSWFEIILYVDSRRSACFCRPRKRSHSPCPWWSQCQSLMWVASEGRALFPCGLFVAHLWRCAEDNVQGRGSLECRCGAAGETASGNGPPQVSLPETECCWCPAWTDLMLESTSSCVFRCLSLRSC